MWKDDLLSNGWEFDQASIHPPAPISLLSLSHMHAHKHQKGKSSKKQFSHLFHSRSQSSKLPGESPEGR